MKIAGLTIGLVWLILICPASPKAAAEDSPASAEKGILTVSSNRLEADEADRKMTFVGDVVGRQEKLVIYAGRLTVYFSPDRLEIEKITATDDVRIVQGDRVATAGRAVFFRGEGKMVLTGSPKVHQGENFVEGEEITLFLDDRKSIVSGGEKRVNAIFHPSGKTP